MQVSRQSGVFYEVNVKPAGETQGLTVLESVRCLECGAVYAKPVDGGTVRQNPGCPDCGYVGWLPVSARPGVDSQPRRYVADRRPHRRG